MLCAETHRVPLFSSAGDPTLQGFVRVVNLSDQSGPVRISAYTDTGVRWGETSFRINGNAVYTFNSDDLEYGSARKGIDGIGTGDGDWHLTFDSDLPLTVSAYLRTRDGFLTAMNRTVEKDPDGIYRVMTFNPGSNTRQVSRLLLVNPSRETVTATVRGMDDRGEAGDRPVTVTLSANEAETLTARQLEYRGLGDGSGKWRLFVTATQPITVMSLLKSATGHLTNLSSSPEAEMEDHAYVTSQGTVYGISGTVIPLFTAADSRNQSFARIINRSDGDGTVIVKATDDSGAVRGTFRLPISANQVLHFNSDDLVYGNADKGIAGVGDGDGDWRLTVASTRTGIKPPSSPSALDLLDLQVLSYMRTRDGFLTALHDLVYDTGHHQVPVFNPGSNMNQESVLRLISIAPVRYDGTPRTNTVTTVTVKGVDDRGEEGDRPVTLTLRGNGAVMLTASELEDMGLGDGSGKWRLLVSADNPVGVMSIMRTVTGHLTNLSYLPETERVIADTLSASFTYEEDGGTPFGIRFNAHSSTGDIVRYDWDFGEVSILRSNTPDTGETPFFAYDGGWSFARTRGDTYGYDGRYPHTDTYTATLTVTDRDGNTATRTKKVRVTNTLSFPGLRDLIGHITDRGGHRGKLVISEMAPGEVFEGSHAEQTVYVSMKEEGVPAEHVFVHGPGVTDWGMLFTHGLLTHPNNASLRAETLVVNRSVLPAFLPENSEPIARNNIVFVAPTGNVSRYGENKCDPEDMPDRDLWRPGHSFYSCNDRDNHDIYRGAMQAIATGKALFATSADLQQDGSVEPDRNVIMCGDTMAYCFAVPLARGNSTSSATAKLSSAVFHLFQLYERAEDVVQALKRCTRDIGEPGIDREFGNGLVDFRCVETMRPVVDR